MAFGDHLKLLALMAGAGAVGAAVSAGLIAHFSAVSSAPSAPSSAPQTPAPQERSRQGTTLALHNLQGRISKLEQAAMDGQEGTADAQASEAASAEVPPPPVHRSFEESRARALQLAHEHSERFTAEAVDTGWAQEASHALESDLGRLQSVAKWTRATVECRTSLCRGTMHWPSYQEAGGSLMTVLSAPYSRNCAITVTLPTPDDPEAPYEGNAFFDCTEDRAN